MPFDDWAMELSLKFSTENCQKTFRIYNAYMCSNSAIFTLNSEQKKSGLTQELPLRHTF